MWFYVDTGDNGDAHKIEEVGRGADNERNTIGNDLVDLARETGR